MDRKHQPFEYGADRPLFSILHTSARPDTWRAIYDAWIAAAVNPEQVEYVLCVDERWGFDRRMGWNGWVNERSGNNVQWNNQRRCYVDGVNIAARASTGRILIVDADDQWPCEGWDERLRNAELIGKTDFESPGEEFVIEVSTGTPSEHERGILVMPILSRTRYERLGYVLYPEYESMYADNDFCEHAKQDGVIIDARYLMFPHRHPINQQAQEDEAYRQQNRAEAYNHGKTIFDWRKRIRFGKALEEAGRIEGWMNPRELAWLSLHASQMGSVVEIGSWKGRSTYAIASGCKGPVYAVDTFAGSPSEPEHQKQVATAGGSVFGEFQRNTKGFQNLRTHEKTSIEAAKQVPDADMVFIDAEHTYEAVKVDLEAWRPKTKKLICGHDATSPEVMRAVQEVLGEVQIEPQTSIWYKAVTQNTKRTIALCLSGEHFQGDWVDGILNLYGHFVQRDFAILRLRDYTTNVYVTREQIRRVIMEIVDPKPDLVLWIDDDNILTPEQFDRLLTVLDEHPEADGVTAWCWIYKPEAQQFQVSCGNWAPDHRHWIPYDPVAFQKETKPREVEATGFPCFLMRRSALEKAGPNAFLPFLDELMEHGLTGEDHAFVRRAQDHGAKFLVDPTVRVQHLRYCDVNPRFFGGDPSFQPVVAVMMRVKNEGRWIKRCLESVMSLAGANIFVFDDESTDDTALIAQSLGVQVFSDPFVGKPLDERRDKNWLLARVKEACNPDWILCIDGDEELQPGGADKILRMLATNPAVDCYTLRFLFLWDAIDTIRMDRWYSSIVRESLFRPIEGFEFKSHYESMGENDPKCHTGFHTSNAPLGLRALRFSHMNVFLLHWGYLHREDRVRKYEWYNRLDPTNEVEDHYRHMVLGDLPELPAHLSLKHAGPLQLRKLPPAMIPKFDGPVPGPLSEEGITFSVSVQEEQEPVPSGAD